MEHFIETLNIFVDSALASLPAFSPLAGLLLTSWMCSLLLLLAFKYLSNQEKIQYHKRKIIGYLLETGIFRDQPGRTLFSQLNMIKHNVLYLRYLAPPVIIMFVPIVLVSLQIEYRIGYAPFVLNDRFIIEATLSDDNMATMDVIKIRTSDSIEIETEALQDYSENKIYWRGKIKEVDEQPWIEIVASGAGDSLKKELALTPSSDRIGPVSQKKYLLSEVIYAAEKPIPSSSAIEKLRVSYPPQRFAFLFWRLSPVTYFFIATILFGLLCKPFFKITI